MQFQPRRKNKTCHASASTRSPSLQKMRTVIRTALGSFLLLFVAVSHAAKDFADCPQFFVQGKPPIVKPRPSHRALCYDAFAILHSGESKTAVYVACL